MGIRMDQFVGLNPWASALVEGERVFAYTQETTRVYPDGRREVMPPKPIHESSVKKEDSGKIYLGMFQDKYPLSKYTAPDGKVYFGAVQDSSWSSGPMFFLALKDEITRF